MKSTVAQDDPRQYADKSMRRCHRHALGMLLALAVTARVADAADPHAADFPEQAVALHDEARALYERGDYRGAVARLEEAVRLDPQAKVLHYNLGLIYEKLGDFDLALDHFRSSREFEKNAIERERLGNDIERIEAARAVAAGEKRRLKLEEKAAHLRAKPPVEPPSGDASAAHRGPWVWAAAGVSAAGFVVAGACAAGAVLLDPGANAITGPGTSHEELRNDASAAHASALAADIGLGLGAAAGLTALVLVLLEAPKAAPAPTSGGPSSAVVAGAAPVVVPIVSSAAAGLSFSLRF
ncbi:MAG: tetratricopeptide repeat protein [Myxococcales bacterium]|nr:tetratricopeptide repeat protein [Myxococcales bacterium]